MQFSPIGVALGGRAPGWAASGNRWAPENLELEPPSRAVDYIFVADDGRGQPHRVGWVRSDGGGRPSSWSEYSGSSLDLGQTAQGETDYMFLFVL